mmetsp:Transcript_1135/g.2440  ORF Transcript_1135/g.2440 Transcript_1135/m.2440 type:complete len:229 (-) Transcript_1135:1759-2445(-)
MQSTPSARGALHSSAGRLVAAPPPNPCSPSTPGGSPSPSSPKPPPPPPPPLTTSPSSTSQQALTTPWPCSRPAPFALGATTSKASWVLSMAQPASSSPPPRAPPLPGASAWPTRTTSLSPRKRSPAASTTLSPSLPRAFSTAGARGWAPSGTMPSAALVIFPVGRWSSSQVGRPPAPSSARSVPEWPIPSRRRHVARCGHGAPMRTASLALAASRPSAGPAIPYGRRA